MPITRESGFREGMERPRTEQGAVIVFVTLLLVFMLAMIGLAFDIGQAFANKSQLQNVADASALAGASALNGTVAGIVEAENRATDGGTFLDNRMGFNTQAVPIGTTEVTYSVMLNGPWLDRANAEASAPTIRFVRTQLLNRPSPVFFGKLIPNVSDVLNLGVEAVAGQEPTTDVCRGLDPFSPAPVNGLPGPDFGYIKGKYYALRLAPGNSGNYGTEDDNFSCQEQGLPGCVTGNFGLADSQGCGPSTNCWVYAIVNGSSNNCKEIGGALPTTPGDKGLNVPRALAERFDQDTDTTDYLANPPGNGSWSDAFNTYNQTTQNYRRIIRVAFNDGSIPQGNSGNYTVMGFGCFWMIKRPLVHPPSAAVCFMYVGACSTSGPPTGHSASITKIVLFR